MFQVQLVLLLFDKCEQPDAGVDVVSQQSLRVVCFMGGDQRERERFFFSKHN